MRLVDMMVGPISTQLNGLYNNFHSGFISKIKHFLDLQLGSDCSHLELRCVHVIDAFDGRSGSDVGSFVCGRWS